MHIITFIHRRSQQVDAEVVSAKEILSELASVIDRSSVSRFNINRNNILDGAFRGFRRKSFHPSKCITVKFADDDGTFEEAVDLGGPRREFFRLLLHALEQSPVFKGMEGQRNLALDSKGESILYSATIIHFVNYLRRRGGGR